LAQAMLYVAAAISLYQGIYNLIPRASSEGYSTDGAHIVAGFFYRDIERHLDRPMRLYNETVSGVRPRDWSAALVQSLKMEALWARTEAVHRMLFQRYFDCGEFDAARQALNKAKECGATGPYIRLEDAFLCAFQEHLPVHARAALRTVTSRHIQQQPMYWRTSAAVAISEGDFAHARNALNRAHKLYRNWLLTTEADLEVMAALETRMRDAGKPFVLSPANLTTKTP